MGFHKICVVVGLVALAHAAYSAAQHRAYLRLTEQEFTRLPWDILIQSLVSLVLTCYGVVHVAGKFKEICASAELDNKKGWSFKTGSAVSLIRTWDTLSNRQAFYSFNHRGKALYEERER